MRVHVCILHPPGGVPLATETEVNDSITRAAAIIKQRFNVKLMPYAKSYVQQVKENPPPSALSVECSFTGYFKDEYGEAGSFFAKNTAGWNAVPVSLTYPVTVFVVEHVTNDGSEWRGCSFGLMCDYLVITHTGLTDSTTLAHELGHTGNLFHRDDSNNLMYHPHTRGTSTTGWQKWWFRASRHVNYW